MGIGGNGGGVGGSDCGNSGGENGSVWGGFIVGVTVRLVASFAALSFISLHLCFSVLIFCFR